MKPEAAFVVAALPCFFFTTVIAQQQDAGLWMSATVQKRITTKLSLTLAEEIRLNENITEAGTLFSEAALDYRFARRWNAGFAYRFIQRRRIDDSYSVRHRLMADLSYRFRIKKFTLTPRLRYQIQYRDVNSSPTGHIPETMLRSRLALRYNLGKRYFPFFNVELFIRLTQERFVDNVRYQAGMDYDLSKYHTLTFFYLINREMQVRNPLTEYVAGMGYRYQF
jgi:hypothetical protein